MLVHMSMMTKYATYRGSPSNGMGGLLQASGRLAQSKSGGLSLAEKFRVAAMADWMKMEAFKELVVPKLNYVLGLP